MDGLSSNKLTWRVTSLQPDVQQTLLEWRTAVFFMLPVTLVTFPLLEAISLFLLPRSSAGIFTAPSGNCRCSATELLTEDGNFICQTKCQLLLGISLNLDSSQIMGCAGVPRFSGITEMDSGCSPEYQQLRCSLSQ